jgi:hypothetical protein
MAIDFTLTPPQRELQLQSRRFAAEVLAGARAAELLPTAEERFLATRPVYEAMVVAGLFEEMHSESCGRRELRPDRHGHHGRGTLQRERERHLDDARNGAWSFADLAGRHAGAVWPAARSVLEEEWNAARRLARAMVRINVWSFIGLSR